VGFMELADVLGGLLDEFQSILQQDPGEVAVEKSVCTSGTRSVQNETSGERGGRNEIEIEEKNKNMKKRTVMTKIFMMERKIRAIWGVRRKQGENLKRRG
jgi:hypothetical protein